MKSFDLVAEHLKSNKLIKNLVKPEPCILLWYFYKINLTRNSLNQLKWERSLGTPSFAKTYSIPQGTVVKHVLFIIKHKWAFTVSHSRTQYHVQTTLWFCNMTLACIKVNQTNRKVKFLPKLVFFCFYVGCSKNINLVLCTFYIKFIQSTLYELKNCSQQFSHLI